MKRIFLIVSLFLILPAAADAQTCTAPELAFWQAGLQSCVNPNTGAPIYFSNSAWTLANGLIGNYTGGVSIIGNSGNGTDQISNVSVNGVFNVKAYGAKGDGSTCDQTAIQNAINAAEAAAISNNPPLFPVVYFPHGSYLVSCNTPAVPPTVSGTAVINSLKLLGDGPQVSRLISHNRTPTLFFEPSNYYSTVLGGNAFSTVVFGGGNVTALNWDTASTANRWLNLKELNAGTHAPAAGQWFSSAAMTNGNTAITLRFFFQFPSGLTNGTTYALLVSHGSDGINTATFNDIHMTPGASNTTLSCSINMSDGNHTVTASIANATLAANTIHFAECNVDSVSNTMNFFLDGTKVNTSASVAANATTSQQPYEQWLIGAYPFGPWGDETDGVQIYNHWVGQIFGLEISDIARNTSNYSAPTSLITADSHTKVLINGTHTQDAWIQPEVDFGGTGSLVWHGGTLQGGNSNSTVEGLGLFTGSYGILNMQSLYLDLIDLNICASESGIRYEDNSYGGNWRGLQFTCGGYQQSNFELIHNSGLVAADNMRIPALGYYGEVLAGSPFIQNGGFLGIGSNTLASISVFGEISLEPYNFNNVAIDVESGTAGPCYQLSGAGSVIFNGGSCETTGTIAPVEWGDGKLSPTFNGVNFNTEGGSPASVLHFDTSTLVTNPAKFSQVSVNANPLSNQPIPACSDMTKCWVEGLGFIPSLTTVSGLPSCAAITTGLEMDIKDCNANCTSYLGTTFTGGGATRSHVKCNGTNWELH